MCLAILMVVLLVASENSVTYVYCLLRLSNILLSVFKSLRMGEHWEIPNLRVPLCWQFPPKISSEGLEDHPGQHGL